MRFSAYASWTLPWSDFLGLTRHVEATGWDGIWLSDHFMPLRGDPTGPYNEAWTTLAALAATVPRVRIGALVSGNTYRHPAVLAKMAASVDDISGGRLVLGLGGAWQESEHTAYGIPFYTVGQRLRRLEEACQVVLGLLENETTTFEGRYYQLKDAPLGPKSAQRPRMPLMIGGAGEKVTLRIAAKYADEWNVVGTPEVFARKSAILDQHCADVGRDPSEIERSAWASFVVTDNPNIEETLDNTKIRRPVIPGTADQLKGMVQQYIDAGATELVFSPINLGILDLEREQYDILMREVISDFR